MSDTTVVLPPPVCSARVGHIRGDSQTAEVIALTRWAHQRRNGARLQGKAEPVEDCAGRARGICECYIDELYVAGDSAPIGGRRGHCASLHADMAQSDLWSAVQQLKDSLVGTHRLHEIAKEARKAAKGKA